MRTPGNILHWLCHIYFLWQPSVLFPWDPFRACLGFPSSGNGYCPPWPHKEPDSKRLEQLSWRKKVINCFLKLSHCAPRTLIQRAWFMWMRLATWKLDRPSVVEHFLLLPGRQHLLSQLWVDVGAHLREGILAMYLSFSVCVYLSNKAQMNKAQMTHGNNGQLLQPQIKWHCKHSLIQITFSFVWIQKMLLCLTFLFR